MVWRQHPSRGLVSSGSTVATTFAPTSAWSSGGSARADADSGMCRRQLEKGGSCVGFVVDGWRVWFPSLTSSSCGGAKSGV